MAKDTRDKNVRLWEKKGVYFYIILRQNLLYPRDFSVVLGYKLPDTGRLFRLRRYDSKAEHRNRIERQRFTDFHVHQATARYQARGFDEDGYAEPSSVSPIYMEPWSACSRTVDSIFHWMHK